VELLGQTSYNDWGFHLSQTYSSSSTPLLETEALTKQENYMTMFQVGRQLNSQLSAQLGLNQSIRSSSIDTISQDIHEWSASPALNYQFWSRFGVGLTGALGYDEVSPGASMKFEQAQGTMNWLVGEKLTMTAGAGVEIRQLMGSELVNPIYSGTITYRPWEQTAASLTASRTVMPSFFQNEVLVDTTVSATFQQRFLEHFNFELSGSYSTMPFVGFARVDEFTNSHQAGTSESTATVQENRKDNSRSVRVSLGSEFRQRGAISIFYSYSDTTSGLSAFALSSTQFGIEIGWRY